MLDYRAQIAALAEVGIAIDAMQFSFFFAPREQALSDLAQARPYAQLGSLIGHLFVHASSDGSEVHILEQAASLWARALAQYNQLASVRAGLEQALADPIAPGAADLFNQATYESQVVVQKLGDLQAEILALRDEIMTMAHVPPHPRQQGKAAGAWDWGNFLLARRTDAFVRALFEHADTPAGRAFAIGALSSYCADTTGSSYLSHAVGGPRRSHRYRDRIARNAVGAFMATKYPAAASTAIVAAAIRNGTAGKTKLPPDVKKLLDAALKQTFDLGKRVPMPDLDAGYRRLLRHMELLDQFARPQPPAMPTPIFTAKLYGDATNAPPSLLPQDFGSGNTGEPDPGTGGQTVGGGSGNTNEPGPSAPDKKDSRSSAGDFCAALIVVAILVGILLTVAFARCCVEWARGKHCNVFDTTIEEIKVIAGQRDPDPPETQDPVNPNVTAQHLQAIASMPQTILLVGFLFQIHNLMWEALNSAHNFLAITGLVYPDGLLGQPRFAQFLAIPPNADWPHRRADDEIDTYHLNPMTSIEHPIMSASPYPPGADPSVFLSGMPGVMNVPSAYVMGRELWFEIVSGKRDTQNLDRDADRGFGAKCWNVKGSINSDPLAAEVLDYAEQ